MWVEPDHSPAKAKLCTVVQPSTAQIEKKNHLREDAIIVLANNEKKKKY